MILLWSACEKDTPTPNPNPPAPEPYEVPVPSVEPSDLLGYRFSVISLTCLKENDNSGHTEDLYGYLEVWVDYEPGYEYTEEGFETHGHALMWYTRKDKYYSMAENDTVAIGNQVDFVVNREFAHKMRIHLKGHVKEHDDGGYNDEDLGVKDIVLEPDDFNIGKLEGLVFTDEHDGVSQVKITYMITKFNPRPRGVYPAGYGPVDNFQARELYPDLPNPTSYEGVPPAISERVIAGQEYWSHFHPGFLQVTTNDNERYYAYRLRDLQNKVNLVSGAGLINPTPEVTPYYNAELNEWYGLTEKVMEYAIGDHEEFDAVEGIKQLYPLQSAPRMQYTRYWKPLEVWRLPAGASISKKKTFTNSGETSGYSEFSAMVGFEAGGLSAELTSTFGSSWTSGWEITQEVDMTYAAPEDKNVLYVVWQLWEEFRIIDDNGDIFSDPNYEFRSMELLTVPTDYVIPKGYVFDAY
jgi:hypothetical protein